MFKPRVAALITKEFLALFRDPKSRAALIVPPIMQLLLFAFAVTLEVKNVSLLIYNQDNGKHGYELVQHFSGSPTFKKIYFANSTNEFRDAIDNQKVMAAVHIPQDFSRTIEAGEKTQLQVLLDARGSNTAQIVSGYITNIALKYAQDIRLADAGSIDSDPSIIVQRNWFNENLLYLWFTIPSLVGILGMLIPLIATSQSVARERELGTFDQILVSPLSPQEILIGKTIPAIIVGMLESLLIFILGIFLFRVPFTGSVLLFFFALFVFILSIVGQGLFISSLSKTQQQALFGTFVFNIPVITLSGYAAPIENMPQWLQYVTLLNPLRYFLVISKGVFLKDMPFADVWANTWPLLIIGIVSLSFAGWFFSKRLE